MAASLLPRLMPLLLALPLRFGRCRLHRLAQPIFFYDAVSCWYGRGVVGRDGLQQGHRLLRGHHSILPHAQCFRPVLRRPGALFALSPCETLHYCNFNRLEGLCYVAAACCPLGSRPNGVYSVAAPKLALGCELSGGSGSPAASQLRGSDLDHHLQPIAVLFSSLRRKVGGEQAKCTIVVKLGALANIDFRSFN